MRDVFVAADNIFSPVGVTTAANIKGLKQNISGVKQQMGSHISDQPFYAALFEEADLAPTHSRYTRFENLLISSITDALRQVDLDVRNEKTLLVLSTTKGNIGLLETEQSPDIRERISLHASAKLVASHFNFVTKPLVISNACISGILAMITGMRLIQAGQYDHVVVAGADAISRFVLSGFQSFQAVSSTACKPFDAARNGINLGEAAATVILSADRKYSKNIRIAGGSVSNDANHISGPSRTGEELCLAILRSMKEAKAEAKDVGLVSAHGTATIYNDEMEAKAITLAGMQSAAVNSLKGFYGHTLGAAGLVESIITMYSLQEGIIFPTLGFKDSGVSVPIKVSAEMQKGSFTHAVKTASGFGGCNAALVMCKQ